MFPYSTEQQDIHAANRYAVDLRVEVTNADGTWKNLSSLAGMDWVDGVVWGWDLDRPVPEARVRLRRDLTDGQSLAPLDEASSHNVDDSGSTNALIDAGRGLRIWTYARHSTAAVASSSDLQLMFDGEIDEVGWGRPQVDIVARSQIGATLADRYVESRTVYGTSSGTAIETVMQSLIDDWADGFTTLWVPTSPGFVVLEYEQQQMSVLQAIQQLQQLIGWDVRERWSSTDGAFRLKLYEPDRSPAAPAATFGPHQYFDVEMLSISRDEIRNVVSVVYPDGSSDGERKNVTVQSTSSADRWGRRWMEIEEPTDSSISTSSEANAMASAALNDLQDPQAEQAVVLPYWYAAEVQDYLRFTANGIHYSNDQDLAVYGVRHELGWNRHRTVLHTRGKPAGQYLGWHGNKRERTRRDPIEEVRDNRMLNLRRVVDTTLGTVTFHWDWGSRCQEVWVHDELVTEPEVTDVFAGFATSAPDVIVQRASDASSYEVAFPSPGQVRILQFEPRDANLVRGPVVRTVVDPQPIQRASDLPDGSIVASKLIKSAQRFGSDLSFSASDYDTVAWSSGTITMSDGTAYVVDAGNTGDMSAFTYLFFDEQVSTSVVQLATNATAMEGDDRILLCVAEPAVSTAQSAFYVPAVGVLGLNEGQLSANIVATNILAANSVTAALINVAQLSAISANIGEVSAGLIVGGGGSTDNYIDLDGSTAGAPFFAIGGVILDKDGAFWYPSGEGPTFGGVVGSPAAGTTDAGQLAQSLQNSTVDGPLRGLAIFANKGATAALLDAAPYSGNDHVGGWHWNAGASSQQFRLQEATTASASTLGSIKVVCGNVDSTAAVVGYLHLSSAP